MEGKPPCTSCRHPHSAHEPGWNNNCTATGDGWICGCNRYVHIADLEAWHEHVFLTRPKHELNPGTGRARCLLCDRYLTGEDCPLCGETGCQCVVTDFTAFGLSGTAHDYVRSLGGRICDLPTSSLQMISNTLRGISRE